MNYLMPISSNPLLPLAKFDPSQPRSPAGTATGGQWTSSGGGEGARAADARREVKLDTAAAKPLRDLWRDDGYDDLSDDQINALRTYTGENYKGINAVLRGQREPGANTARWVTRMDSAFDQTELPKETTVYRGLSDRRFDAIARNFKSDKPYFADYAYVSTTTSKDVATGRFSEGTHKTLRIVLPKGSKAIPVAGISKNVGEHEVLVDRAATFRIRSVGRTEIVAELVSTRGRRAA